MPKYTFNIFIDPSDALNGLGKLKDGAIRAIEAGIEKAAKELLKDCRPYVPMLTGALRDSGRVEDLENLAFRLIWDAANPANNYVYARKQYEEVLQHVDGRYAARWVEKVFRANPLRYLNLAALYMEFELARILGRG